MGWLTKLFGSGQADAPRLPKITCRQGSYPTSAVGESNYQTALEMLCGGYRRYGHELECEAQLVPEPTNPYDENAVKIMIGGYLVGYLSREDAIRFQAKMAAAGRAGQSARCAAKVKGGWRTNQHDQGSFGVRLGVPRRGAFTFE